MLPDISCFFFRFVIQQCHDFYFISSIRKIIILHCHSLTASNDYNSSRMSIRKKPTKEPTSYHHFNLSFNVKIIIWANIDCNLFLLWTSTISVEWNSVFILLCLCAMCSIQSNIVDIEVKLISFYYYFFSFSFILLIFINALLLLLCIQWF